MRTVKDIANKHKNGSSGPSADDWYEENVVAAMKEYGKEILDEIMSDPSMIYIDRSDRGRCDDEAVYSYEAFEKFKEKWLI